MSDSTKKWAPRPMTITITDKGQSLEVTNVDKWVEEAEELRRRGRAIVSNYDGNPPSLYSQYGVLAGIVARLAQIRVIIETFKRARVRYADDGIVAMVKYFSDTETTGGFDD